MLKDLLLLEIFAFTSWLFGHVEKRFDKKAMVDFEIHDVIDWRVNNYHTHIIQYLKN